MGRSDIVNWPNLLTISRIVLTPLFLTMLFAETWYWKSLSVVVFGLASLTDFYDGRLARSGNQVTALGRFLDPLADKILVTAALVALVWGRLVYFWLVVPIIVRDVLITIMRMHSIYRGRQMATSKLAKWKTALQLFSVVVILFGMGLQEVLEHFSWDIGLPLGGPEFKLLANGLMASVLLLTLLSGIHYVFRTSFEVNKP
ncbi:MAG: CDP-diacylglycerol--glycerol-3-phosphate 3-phosphatidyltransferase [Candidatus Latescibacteria bacterium]|nr:CDP-diacylglycerol--glycerol-3-phosphate 3-phosphatidyltransferase [Candidatus Latescibacterota bacterium]